MNISILFHAWDYISNYDFRYLLNFCRWQRDLKETLKPQGDKNPKIWDHGLLLSGLNLWEGKKEYDSVIGII